MNSDRILALVEKRAKTLPKRQRAAFVAQVKENIRSMLMTEKPLVGAIRGALRD